MTNISDNIVLSQAETIDKEASISLEDRVYLERIRQFFGHAAGNMASALFGALLMGMVLHGADTPLGSIAIWFSTLTLFALIVVFVEFAFSRANLLISNARQWMMYGMTPFLFSDYISLQQEMFIFIILSAMVSVASTGYSVIPYHYLTVNGVTLVPLTLYFVITPTKEHLILASTSTIWQLVVLSKAWAVSKTSINAIHLNERLRDEVSQHKETKERLRHMATHDGLTGLPNRRLLVARLDSMVSWAHRYKKRIVIMFVDLDGFKAINDSHGHECGDAGLQEIAKRLQEQVRETDAIARIGGDEFVLAYTEVDDVDVDASMLGNRVLDSVKGLIPLPNGEMGGVSCSIGIALYPDDGMNSGKLLISADEAMYAAKARGKNCFYLASHKTPQHRYPH